jgi:hypothetical protein
MRNRLTSSSPRLIRWLLGFARQISVKFARASGLGVLFDQDNLPSGVDHRFDDATVTRLETGRSPADQLDLILESLELLDESDARVIRDRLGGKRENSARADGAIGSLEACYGLAVIRLSERLDWVAGQQSRGVSPPQRRALGLIKFQCLAAQVVADRLRLPIEAVEYWVREGAVSH